ncbi:MAG TPA: DUF433 domain-containing protein [Prolixibacteraceae bacterium]|nr:DUF433 domain-containing protein [Prolixibacteraceae bacterium]
MKYTTINIQGNLISEEILQKVEKAEAQGQSATDFGFEPGSNIRSEIEYAWSRIKLDWKHFSDRLQNLPASDPYGTMLSRKWMEQFLSSIGFDLLRQRTSLQGDNNQSYAISHTAENADHLPIHIVGFFEPNHPDKNTLDIKTSGGTTRFSPHGTMQEYLNVTEHLFGIATNGLYLRLIRDSGLLIKLTYVEFDIKRMLDEDKYSEFTVLYRLIHVSRFPLKKVDATQCLLDKYYQDSIETGNRIRNGLSLAVKESLVALGKGFLQHENNTALRDKIQAGTLSPKDYYRQLLRIIYRFLFLMVTEERDLVYDPDDKTDLTQRLKKLYIQYYSIHRLRKLSENRYVFEAQFTDLWQGLINTFLLFEAGGNGKKLGIQPLDGELFSYNAIADLQNSLINNKLLLECVRNMNEFTDENRNLVPINYRSLDVEELGSVYEGLLELHAVIENIEASNPGEINFTFHEGTDRKTTGSYYTRPDLVNELIKSALIPVIEERLKEHSDNKEEQAKALLKLKVCDPASGSGHMMLAAARTIAWYLARVQSGEENPAPSLYRTCLREVIQHCIYAVDMNPDAVELCKLALWLEGHCSGKPLSFLDHKIRCGNSLVGVTYLSVLEKGIPNDAYYPITSNDKAICLKLKKDNQRYLKFLEGKADTGFQQTLKFEEKQQVHMFSTDYHQLEDINQDDVEAVKQVKTKFEQLRNKPSWFKDWTACNLWTAAFFFHYTPENEKSASTSEHLISFLSNPSAAYAPIVGKANSLSIEHNFFHWALEFPDVFEQGGFDVMLGNPPWESVQLEEKQYFENKIPEISRLKGNERKEAIKKLKGTELYAEFINDKHAIESQVSFIRGSLRFEKTASSKINTYQCFTELLYQLINERGRGGIIIPLGIVTEESTNELFIDAISKNRLHSIVGFENEEFLFKNVANVVKFCLLTFFGNTKKNIKPRIAFHFRNTNSINNEMSYFYLDKEAIDLFNPKTKTSPLFRTKIDFELNERIYKKSAPIFGSKKYDDLQLMQGLYNMTIDSSSFLKENGINCLPLYESKFIWQYEHRFGSMELKDYLKGKGGRGLPNMPIENSQNPSYRIKPQYYVNQDDLQNKIPQKYDKKWFMVYRGIGEAKRERTFVSTIIPYSGIGNSSSIIFPYLLPITETIYLLANFNSLIFDYMAKQKIPGVNINQFYVIQIPIATNIEVKISLQIVSKCLELIYTSWDIKAFVDDVWKEADEDFKEAIKKQWEDNKAATGGHEWIPPEWCEIDHEGCPLPPFKWDEERRAILKAELDAIYAKLYGLTTEELRYILDPKDVYGSDFPGETFRVLKEKEIRKYGEYRTRRLVLEAWEKLNNPSKESQVSITGEIISKLKQSITYSSTMKEFSLNEGIYSVQDVSRITRLSAEKVRRWFKELSDKNYEGLALNQKKDIESMRICFHGLVELVVIGTLRENGFTLTNILKARTDLQSKSTKIYPFATNNVKVNLKVIPGKGIYFKFPEGLVKLDGKGQYNLNFIFEFFANIEFDIDGIALRLFPLHNSKLIVVDPKIGGGKPVISEKGIYVEMIQRAHAGKNSVESIMDQFDLNLDEINAALEYSLY